MRNGSALSDVCVPDGSCSICADEGLIGEVLEVRPDAAQVRIGREVEDVAIDLLERVRVGDRVVVHLGFAIARVRDE